MCNPHWHLLSINLHGSLVLALVLLFVGVSVARGRR
jgi:hypothetical protein